MNRAPLSLVDRFALGLFLVGCAAGALTSVARAAGAPACDPNNGGITLPAGFCAFLAADGLGEARHIAVAPNGDVYVGLMNGGVAALRDTNGDGRFEMKEKFGSQRDRCRAAQRLSLHRHAQHGAAL